MTSKIPNADHQIIFNELCHLHASWFTLSDLYYHPDREMDEQIEQLLIASAQSFFVHVRWLLLDNLILGICRLTDPPRMGRYEHAGIERLIRNYVDEPEDFLDQLETYKATYYALRRVRNSELGHLDFEQAKTSLAGTGNSDYYEAIRLVGPALMSLTQLFNAICIRLGESENPSVMQRIELLTRPYTDINKLLQTLRRAFI